MPDSPKVFISYSHDDRPHQDRILNLSNRLRRDGIDCRIDQYEISPPQGWPRWMDEQIEEADYVLVVCTQEYHQRFKGKGDGKGVKWEGAIIRQDLYDAETINEKYIPLLFSKDDEQHRPGLLRGVNYYNPLDEEGYWNLYRHLTKQPDVKKPELGKLIELLPRNQQTDFFQPWNVPFTRNEYFTGREQILIQLHQTLTDGGTAALSQQAIYGLGGIGKTQTAVEYAYRHRQDYPHVLWVRSETEANIYASYTEIAEMLGMEPQQDQKITIKAVKHWLQTQNGWLLIYDNADDLTLLKKFYPHTTSGSILITTRTDDFAQLGIKKQLEIETLPEKDAVDFLCTRTKTDITNPENEKAIKDLAAELGNLPLALEQAGAYIQTNKVSVQAYLNSYREKNPKHLLESKGQTGDYEKTIATTWTINFEEVENQHPAAADILRFSAFTAPDNIPLELLIKGGAELGKNVAKALKKADSDQLAIEEALLTPLLRYSLIRKDPDANTYSIHRLVQQAIKFPMKENKISQWAEQTVRAVDASYPGPDFKYWPQQDRLIPHTFVVAQLIEKHNFAFQEAGNLLNKLGYCLNARARYEEAESIYQRALTITENTLGPDHPDTAIRLNNLAALYDSQGRYDQAEPLYQRAMKIDEKALGPNHPDLAIDLNNLAGLYRAQGRYDQAEPLYQRAIQIFEKALGQNHPNTIGVKKNYEQFQTEKNK